MAASPWRKSNFWRPKRNSKKPNHDVRDQDDLARYKQLVDKEEISKQLYDQSVAASKASAAGVAAARANDAAAEQAVNQAQTQFGGGRSESIRRNRASAKRFHPCPRVGRGGAGAAEAALRSIRPN